MIAQTRPRSVSPHSLRLSRASFATRALLVLILLAYGDTSFAEARLEQLGHYDARGPGTLDHILGVALKGDDALLVASSAGMVVVDRLALETDIVRDPLADHAIDPRERSNLDGAGFISTYRPRLYNVVTRGDYAYAASRYDGLWVLRTTQQSGAWSIEKISRLVEPREFTEGIAVRGTWLVLAHHRDGIEVMDLAADPAAPASVARLDGPFVDAWGVDVSRDATKIWVADGQGGVKLIGFDGNALTHLGGDTLATSPGTVYDVKASGDWVVGAVGVQGLAVYRESTAEQVGLHRVPGMCVGVERMARGRFAIACRSWIHVVEVDDQGLLTVVASARLHRDAFGRDKLGINLGRRVSVFGDILYVASWNVLEAFRLVEDDSAQIPDIRLGPQRIHFGAAAGTREVTILNGGNAILHLEGVACEFTGITCALDRVAVSPGKAATLTVSFDGLAQDVQGRIDVFSDDPNDPAVGILVRAVLDEFVDPLELAPDFTATTITRFYASETFIEAEVRLSGLATRGRRTHLAVFGSWCPACGEPFTGMPYDIDEQLPPATTFLLVNQEEPQELVEHVLEKIYVPATVVVDPEGTIGDVLYQQPAEGLPFARGYVIDENDVVTHVFTGYNPAAVLDALAE